MTDGPTPRRRATKSTAKKSAPPPQTPPPGEDAIDPPPSDMPTVPPPPEVSPAVAAAAIGEAEHGERDGESNRLRTVLAILIALISITGALVTWRAEVAGSEAGRADREGTIVAVSAEGARQQAEAQARAEARAAQRAYETNSAGNIYQTVRDNADSTGEYDAANRKYLQENGVAIKLTDGYFVLDFVEHDDFGYVTNPEYDVDGRVADILAQQQTETDSERFFEEADAMESRRGDLYALDVMLVLALALIAVGQLTRRRQTAIAWAVPGTALFLVATALFIVVEV